MKPPQKYPLQWVLSVVLALQIVGFVGLTGYLAWRNEQGAMANIANRLTGVVSNHIADCLNTYLQKNPPPVVTSNQQTAHQQQLPIPLSQEVFQSHSSMAMAALSHLLSQVNLFITSQILILDRSGSLIATSTLEPVVISDPFSAAPPSGQPAISKTASISHNSQIRTITEQLRDRVGELRQIQSTHTLRLRLHNQTQFVRVTPYQNPRGFDWLVVVMVPESEFSAPIAATISNIWQLMGTAFIVALATGLMASRWIVQPIRRLSQASQALATGNWQPLLVDSSPIAELSALTASFNSTATQLQQAFARIQADLNKSEEKFTALFRTSPDPIAIARLPDGCILEANISQLEFFGYQREELLGHTAAELNLWADPNQELQFYEHFQTLGMVRNLEVDLRTKSGEIKTGLVSAELFNFDGEESVIVVTRDITERKQAQIALQQAKESAELANQAKSTFLANMSHELRSPLNVMLGFTQLMNSDPTISPENQDYLQLIQSNGEHLLRLINDVLDLSKIEAGQLSLQEQEFDLLALLHDLERTFSLRARQKGLQLFLEVLPGVPQYVRFDKAKLNQVLINLVNNAIKFTRQGSVRLVVTAVPPSSITQPPTELMALQSHAQPGKGDRQHVKFQIIDTGVGMTPEEQAIIRLVG